MKRILKWVAIVCAILWGVVGWLYLSIHIAGWITDWDATWEPLLGTLLFLTGLAVVVTAIVVIVDSKE